MLLSLSNSDINPDWILPRTSVHLSMTNFLRSASVRSPSSYHSSISAIWFSVASIKSFFLEYTLISANEIVIPATVEYLNPKSFNLSNILEVSEMWNNLKTLAITSDKNFFLNGSGEGIEANASFGFTPFEMKYISGVFSSKLNELGSLTYGNVSGKISLKINLPNVVTKYLSFCSGVNVCLT